MRMLRGVVLVALLTGCGCSSQEQWTQADQDYAPYSNRKSQPLSGNAALPDIVLYLLTAAYKSLWAG